MEDFASLLLAHGAAAERLVRFSLPPADADDVLQEVYLTAYQKYHTLKDPGRFKPWLLSLARNKCRDYFRARARTDEIPLDEVPEEVYGRQGVIVYSPVAETMERLSPQERQILSLYYYEELPQTEIARRLNIPLGTVKSRLHNARAAFKAVYPYPPKMKGDNSMKKMPGTLPAYTITPSELPPFAVKWEELMGWFLVPKLGEKLTWGMYDIPSRKCDHIYEMQVTGKAEVHGVEGVELTAREAGYAEKQETIDRTFVAQLTDTHCRYLAAHRTENGVRKYLTFLDTDQFYPPWGYGEDNCGNETNLVARGEIRRSGNEVRSAEKDFLLDIVGRYTVAIGGQTYDTVCVMSIESVHAGVVSEQFLDRNGRTILWRRFNRNDWSQSHYGKPWTELLPDNDRLIINGETYVEWYDCITDYIL